MHRNNALENDFETSQKGMISHKFLVWLLLILVIWTPLSTALATDFDSYEAPAPVSLDTLDSRIKDAQANTNLDEQTKANLLVLYRKTIRYLEDMHINSVASDAFIHSKKSDSEQAARKTQSSWSAGSNNSPQ